MRPRPRPTFDGQFLSSQRTQRPLGGHGARLDSMFTFLATKRHKEGHELEQSLHRAHRRVSGSRRSQRLFLCLIACGQFGTATKNRRLKPSRHKRHMTLKRSRTAIWRMVPNTRSIDLVPLEPLVANTPPLLAALNARPPPFDGFGIALPRRNRPLSTLYDTGCSLAW